MKIKRSLVFMLKPINGLQLICLSDMSRSQILMSLVLPKQTVLPKRIMMYYNQKICIYIQSYDTLINMFFLFEKKQYIQ